MLNVGVLFVLAVGPHADEIEDAEGVTVLRRVRDVVLAEADTLHARELEHVGDYVQVYRARDAALRALSVYE
jgi:hypothetical protein